MEGVGPLGFGGAYRAAVCGFTRSTDPLLLQVRPATVFPPAPVHPWSPSRRAGMMHSVSLKKEPGRAGTGSPGQVRSSGTQGTPGAANRGGSFIQERGLGSC